jgi:hypothetical protein
MNDNILSSVGDPKERERVQKTLARLMVDPWLVDFRKIKGQRDRLRFRVGNWRTTWIT